jgi:hypothetical protein
MSKPKRAFMEFSPGRGSAGVMDEYARQMNSLAQGLATGRVSRPQAPDKSRQPPERPRRTERG